MPDQKYFRYCRIVFASVVFLGFVLLFFYPPAAGGSFNKWFLYFQIVPAIKAFTLISLSFFTCTVLFTLLFGRLYCSFLCPLGIYQDIVIFMRRVRKKAAFKYRPPFRPLTYILLVAFLLSFISGKSPFLILMDPYSVFGRFVTNVYRPLAGMINNIAVGILEIFGFFKLPYLNIHHIGLRIFLIVFLYFLFVNISAFFFGRWYCVNICPVGAVLGGVSKSARFKVRIDSDKCTNCGVCESVCRTGCINSKEFSVSHSECVECFDCLSVCRFDAISFSCASEIRKKASCVDNSIDDSGRRNFFRKFFAVALLPGFSKMKSLVRRDKMVPVTPPGSVGVDNFSSKCIACNLCVSNCPNSVLVPSFLDYGPSGIMQPKMNYGVSFCSYECNKCSRVCPTGAIKPISLELKKRTQIGVSSIKRTSCIPYALGKDCGACAEHCPTQAVHMEAKGDIFVPVITPELCIGCGVCEYVCPTSPKSITVSANRLHKLVRKPSSAGRSEKSEHIVYELPF